MLDRNKICMISIGMTILFASCGGGRSSDNNKNETAKESENVEPNVAHVTDEVNVVKWFDQKSNSNKETYVLSKLEGSWSKKTSLNYVFEDLKKDIKLNRNPHGEKIAFTKSFKYEQEYNTKKGLKTISGSYSVTGPKIAYTSQNDNHDETILYISENILITYSKISELGFEFINFAIFQNANSKSYKSELKEFLKEFFANSYSEFGKKAGSGALSDLLNTYRKLEFISLLDKAIYDIKKDSLIILVRDGTKTGFGELVSKTEKEYREIKSISDFDITKDLENKLPILVELWKIADALGFEKKEVTTLYKKINNELQDFAVYGPGKEYQLKSAAESFLESNSKDPDSFEFIDGILLGKNKQGLVYRVKFRGKNSFGAKVIDVNTLVLAYDKDQGIYNVVNMQ